MLNYLFLPQISYQNINNLLHKIQLLIINFGLKHSARIDFTDVLVAIRIENRLIKNNCMILASGSVESLYHLFYTQS